MPAARVVDVLRCNSYSAAPLAAGDWTRLAEPVVLHTHGVQVEGGWYFARQDLLAALLVSNREGQLNRVIWIVGLGGMQELCVLTVLSFTLLYWHDYPPVTEAIEKPVLVQRAI